jgi:hypothetical protein
MKTLREKRMTSMASRRLVLGAMAASPLVGAFARVEEVDQLTVGRRLARFGLLEPGSRTYLRSIEKDGAHVANDIWRREVRFEDVEGVPRLRIVQRWDGTGQTPSLAERDSVFELETFRPLTHVRATTRDGTRVVEGFRFTPEAIIGLADLPDNARAAFAVASPEPVYNFETDMEMLQALPWSPGYAVSIPFYHPGGGAPARYLWRMAEQAVLTGPDGSGIDCWVVETDYNSQPASMARFWLAKSTQQLIRMEHRMSNGGLQRKTLLY